MIFFEKYVGSTQFRVKLIMLTGESDFHRRRRNAQERSGKRTANIDTLESGIDLPTEGANTIIGAISQVTGQGGLTQDTQWLQKYY